MDDKTYIKALEDRIRELEAFMKGKTHEALRLLGEPVPTEYIATQGRYPMMEREEVRLLREEYGDDMADAWEQVEKALKQAELYQYNYVDKLLDLLNEKDDK